MLSAVICATGALWRGGKPRESIPCDGTPTPPWSGISMDLAKEVPAVEGVTAKAGIRVVDLPAGSPAGKCGVRAGDIIVGIDGKDWEGNPDDIAGAYRAAVMARKPGDALAVRIVRSEVEITRDGKPAEPETWTFEEWLRRQPPGTEAVLKGVHRVRLVELKIVLQARPEPRGKSIPAKLDLAPGGSPEEQLAEALVAHRKLGDPIADLRRRLAALHQNADVFRMNRMAFIHREPFRLRALGTASFDRLALDPLAEAAAWLDAEVAAAEPLKTGLTFEKHVEQLVASVAEARRLRDAAFAALSAEDMAFLDANLDSLTDKFAEHIYLESDDDKPRFARHQRVLDLATRVDFPKLFAAARTLWRARAPEYVKDLEAAVRAEWEARGRPEGVFLTRDTDAGKLIVSGSGRSWHRDDAAILLDLAGDDVYTQNSGAGRGSAALLIDFAGDDAYEATQPWTQGAGRLGVGCLVDAAGNDRYLAVRWAQGAAALGASLLADLAGDDAYRVEAFGQAAALWGVALLEDASGADTYEARLLSQAVGMPGGAAALVDSAGNDHFYAKGRNPTSYGDAGIFDAWSQGCGVGFRGLQSGGAGLLLDRAGDDAFEGANFSQGGGYYFGTGLLCDAAGNDRFTGSRYNQAFSAHEAAGFFEDRAGNDTYDTRHGVAQGLAWDESVTCFVDRAGDDTYHGWGGFSQGATAHNAICVFLDLAGRDRYLLDPQARAGPNDYHGGASLSLFVDAGGEADEYAGAERNSAIVVKPEHGFACDLEGTMEEAVKDGACLKMVK
ncbi:MAG: PDZ domain-containing protein [Planctomycetes bacterium]|nr:PDZ domain-containing protein [Planctomycetota bacterium]